MVFSFTILLIINFIVTYNLIKNKNYTKKQKNIQIFIIWLIPIMGALIIYILLNREEKQKTIH